LYYECRHIMHNGARCHSPALRDTDYCYFHTTLHNRASQLRTFRAKTPKQAEPLDLPILEDRSAIQVALTRIVERLCSSDLESRRAGLLLYALQIAAQNVERKTDILPFRGVEAVYHTDEGEELAPRRRVCEDWDKCTGCDLKDTCRDYEPEEEEDEP
jgi:hypothetical protein